MKSLIVIYLMFMVSIDSLATEYKVPKKPASVAVADINLDGHLDIVLGHDPDSETAWSGVSILINDGKGNFTLKDSVFLFAGQPSIHVRNIDLNPYPEIFAKYYSYDNNNEYIAVISNYNLDSLSLFPLNTTSGINSFEVSNINYDNSSDILVTSHLGKFWGILYNNGNGEFSTPVYYNLDFYPNSLSVGKINNDDRYDIAVSGNGKKIKIYINKSTGFDTVNVDTSPRILSDIKIADINNDGKNEIIGIDAGIPGTKKRILIYSRGADNSFYLSHISQWINEAMAKIFIADLNNDTYQDIIYNVTIYYPNSDYELFHTYILFNNQDGTFQYPVNYFTGICSHTSYAADLDGNGWNDIITLNYDFYNPPPKTCSIHILFNDGTGKFQENPITGVKDEQLIPRTFELYQNYPNPFNPITHFRISIAEFRWVSLKIYDGLGKEVETLVNEMMHPGTYTVEWNAVKCASGMYFVRLQAGNYSAIRKISLIK
ncbi:MAG: T9SS type A sorting domain-containing protein [Bacteroidetes bacterium]|nr:T9SS type A sorting domain-containing protein [Bacteroidota bacterium]MBU2506763.1 T9SS type A sorting domain-containing protein [Bacteroidota bacterium]